MLVTASSEWPYLKERRFGSWPEACTHKPQDNLDNLNDNIEVGPGTCDESKFSDQILVMYLP